MASVKAVLALFDRILGKQSNWIAGPHSSMEGVRSTVVGTSDATQPGTSRTGPWPWLIVAGALAIRLLGADRPIGCYRLGFSDDYDEISHGGGPPIDMLLGRSFVDRATGSTISTPFWPVPQHPPLAYWLMYVFARVLGWSPFTVRLPHIIAGATTVWLMYRMGGVFDRRAGLLAGLWGATCTYLVHFQHTAILEPLLTAFLTGGFYLLILHFTRPRKSSRFLVAAVGCFLLAVFTKVSGLMFLPVWLLAFVLDANVRHWFVASRRVQVAIILLLLAAGVAAVLRPPGSLRLVALAAEKLGSGLNGIGSPLRLDYLRWSWSLCGLPLLLAPIGVVLAWRQHPKATGLLASAALLGIGVPFALREQCHRWIVPALPLLVLFASIGFVSLLQFAWRAANWSCRRRALGGLAILAVVVTLQPLVPLTYHLSAELTCRTTDPYISQLDKVVVYCLAHAKPGQFVAATDAQALFYISHASPNGFALRPDVRLRTRDLCFEPPDSVERHRPSFVLLDKSTVETDTRPALRANIAYTQTSYRLARRFPDNDHAVFFLYVP